MSAFRKSAAASAGAGKAAPAKALVMKAPAGDTNVMKLRRASEMLDRLYEKARDLSARAAKTRARLS